jgi:hypothetical protein
MPSISHVAEWKRLDNQPSSGDSHDACDPNAAVIGGLLERGLDLRPRAFSGRADDSERRGHIPVQSPPTNLVALTAGTADGTEGVLTGACTLGVSAMMLLQPLVPAELLAVSVMMPMTATAPAAATNDNFFGDTLTDCISNAPKSAL